MSRLPEINRGMIPEKLRSAFDELIADSGGNVPIGPGSVAAISPEMALRRRPLSNYVRWELRFPQVLQELAILVTARSMDCEYVWSAHVQLALGGGASQSLVDAIYDQKALPVETPDDYRTVIEFTRAIVLEHAAKDELFDAAMKLLGIQNLIDLMALTGQYITNSLFINSFELEIPEPYKPEIK